MKHLNRALVVALVLAGTVLASQAAGNAATRHCTKTYSLVMFKRAARAAYAGTSNPPVGSYGHLWRFAKCLRRLKDRPAAMRAWKQQHDAWAARRHPPAPSALESSDLADVPGVPYSFAACVAYRESDDGRMGDTIYGIIPSSGYDVEGASLAVQKQAFSELYAADGTSPWSGYDGC